MYNNLIFVKKNLWHYSWHKNICIISEECILLLYTPCFGLKGRGWKKGEGKGRGNCNFPLFGWSEEGEERKWGG